MPELRRIAYRLSEEHYDRIQTLSWLHGGNATEALREAIDRYYEAEGERAEAVRRVVEGAVERA